MMTANNALKYRQFVYPTADGDSTPKYEDAGFLAFSTLPQSRENEPISRVYLIKPGKLMPPETTMHRMWLHDILDDNDIPYLVEAMGVFVSRRKFGQMQGIYVLDSDYDKAIALKKKFEKAACEIPEELEEAEFIDDGDNSLLQSKCRTCGKEFDFDYPKCPYCKTVV